MLFDMRKLCVVLLLVCECSCQFLEPKQEFRFVYGFENELNVSDTELENTIKVLEARLTSFGVKSKVKRLGKHDIEILIKTSKLDIKQIDKLISNRGKLEFWELYNNEDFIYDEGVFFEINNSKKSNDFDVTLDLDVIFVKYAGTAVILNAKAKDTFAINNILSSKQFKKSLPVEIDAIKPLWGIVDKDGYLPLYVAKTNTENKPLLTGKVITKARQIFGVTGRPEIAIEMNNQGALIWERITEKVFQNQTRIAIVINDIVYSAPSVSNGGIKGGRSSIFGNFTIDEAQNLAAILSSRTPIPQLKLLEQSIIKN